MYYRDREERKGKPWYQGHDKVRVSTKVGLCFLLHLPPAHRPDGEKQNIGKGVCLLCVSSSGVIQIRAAAQKVGCVFTP